MKMINVESIEREHGKIIVTLSVQPFDNFNYNHRLTVSTSDVENILREKRIRYASCIQEGHILNRREKTCRSTWIFEAPSSTRKRSKKSKKTLDKPVEDVIIVTEPKDLEEIKDLEETKQLEE